MEKVITNNAGEKVAVNWDGTRFAIVTGKKNLYGIALGGTVIILNPKQMLEISIFANSILSGKEPDEKGTLG